MERKDYENTLKHIDKMEQKIAIKKANGIDVEKDEFKTDISMLEFIEKITEACPSRIISAEELEVKKLFSELNTQSKDSKDYCLLIINLLKNY